MGCPKVLILSPRSLRCSGWKVSCTIHSRPPPPTLEAAKQHSKSFALLQRLLNYANQYNSLSTGENGIFQVGMSITVGTAIETIETHIEPNKKQLDEEKKKSLSPQMMDLALERDNRKGPS